MKEGYHYRLYRIISEYKFDDLCEINKPLKITHIKINQEEIKN